MVQNAWGLGGTLEGTNIKWSLSSTDDNQTYTLIIKGSGDMPDYEKASEAPWYGKRAKITTLIISEGITKIGGKAFNGTAITSLDIPASCNTIGYAAFVGNTNLTELYIPETVTTIGGTAFNTCRNLTLVHYDGRCTPNNKLALGVGAATGKIIEKSGTGTSYAKVPEGWEYYTHGEKCQGGAWVAENADQTKLFFYAKDAGATVDYASAVVLSEDDQDASNHPWRLNCYKYTSLEIDKNIAAIGVDELRGYVNNTVSRMGYTNMQTITVDSNNPNFIVGENGALYNKAMTTVYLYPAKNAATNTEIPATVTTIRPGAFYGAKNLQKISFLGTISQFGTYALAQASSLNYLYFATKTAPTTTATTSFTGVASKGVVAADADTDAFRTFTKKLGTNWTFDGETYGPVKTYISDGTLYVVGKGAYTSDLYSNIYNPDTYAITKIVVKEGITNIGISAFSGCSKVTEVTLKNSGSIRYSAFKDCKSLTRVNIGTGVTELEYNSNYGYPFEGCSNLSIINIEDFAKFNAIKKLYYLTDSWYGTCEEKILLINGVANSYTGELVIPEGITSINRDAIKYFKNVTKIKIPSTVTYIQENNFSYSYLTEITVPATVGNVGEHAFSGCTALKTVTLNNNGSIGIEAFSSCSALTRVNIGSGVTGFKYKEPYISMEGSIYSMTLYYWPFEGCSNLSIVNIADFASFNAIENLKLLTDSEYGTAAEKTLMVNGTTHNADDYFYIPEGVTSYNNDALGHFSNVKKVCLPSTMTTVDGFSNHKYLTRVTLPSSVTSVEKNAFYGCSALKFIACPTITVPSVTGAIATNPNDIELRVPNDYRSLYRAADVWKDFYILGANNHICDVVLYGNESYNINSTELSGENVVWNNTDPSAAQVSTNENGRFITSCDFTTYDGSTSLSYRATTIMANLADGEMWQFNVTVNPKEVILTDGNAYKNTEDHVVDKISYTRTYAEKYAGNLQCFYVPFDVEVTDDLLEDFTFYKLYMVSQKDENGNGEIEEDEPLVMLLNRIPAGQVMTANMPYYIRPKAESTLTVTAYNTTLYAATNGKVSCSTTEKEYTLTGNNASKNIKGYYTMSAKGNFSYYTKDTTLGSYRWYMSVRDRMGSGAEYENYARPIEILIVGEDDTTGIASLEDKVPASKNDKIYTLDGRQVTDFETLPSGIYIVNGKKIYKK